MYHFTLFVIFIPIVFTKYYLDEELELITYNFQGPKLCYIANIIENDQ